MGSAISSQPHSKASVQLILIGFKLNPVLTSNGKGSFLFDNVDMSMLIMLIWHFAKTAHSLSIRILIFFR